MQTAVPMDPEREILMQEAIKLVQERNAISQRNQELRRGIVEQNEEVERIEDQIAALLSIGQYIGEILKPDGDNKYIVKSNSGARHLVGCRQGIRKEQLTFGARVALDITTFTIVKVLPREVNARIFNMQFSDSDKSTQSVSFQDVGGLQEQMRQMREVVELPLTNPELFERVGISAPKGVLLYGPPGTGKTLLARAIASNVDANFLKVVASSIIDKYIGESQRIMRDMFQYARDHQPCVMFIDEIDAIGGKRVDGNASDREVQRTLMELLNQLDGFDSLGKVKIIMATNRPDILDEALLRPGRLDRKVEIGLPNPAGRLDILKIHSSKLTKQGDIDFDSLVKLSDGFNGADLRNVCTEAGMLAIRDDRDYILNEDMNRAVRKVSEMKRLESTPHQYAEH
eukprot:gene8576-6016_t